ncbi:MAG: hypothetical protein ACLTN0_06030 [Coprococcus phoceensis]
MIEADGNKYLALTEKGKDVTNMNNFTMGIKEARYSMGFHK